MKAYRERDIVDWLVALEERVAALEGRENVPRPVAAVQPDKPHEPADATPLSLVWNNAPLVARLQFLKALVPAGHPYLPAIEEACVLSEYHGKPEQLEAWIRQYPALFADGVERLLQDLPAPQEPVEHLIQQTLAEARQSFQAMCAALGLEWILPVIGAPVTKEHEVLAEQEASVPPGTIAAVHRRGIRQRGTLLLPAQVSRASPASRVATDRAFAPDTPMPAYTGNVPTPPAAQTAARDAGAARTQDVTEPPRVAPPAPLYPKTAWGTAKGVTEPPCAAPPAPVRRPVPSPGWLSRFLQRSESAQHPDIRRLAAALPVTVDAITRAISEGEPGRAAAELESLLRLLHTSRAGGASENFGQLIAMLLELRNKVYDWLRACGFEVIDPAVGAPFDASTMQVVEHRRTAHAQEHDRVARLERAGLRYGQELLFPALVVVYRKEDVQ
ncbi:MAG: nucleotide exchange factor GrpE [Chloroherpetonaceae bacterium]|nr:nucleotide exchange factor GrpE [Chloroherpetonaceae bacterium]